METIDIYKKRRNTISTWLKENKMGAAVFIDNEDCRSQTVRYFTNHPSDAIVIITASGKSILCPWDEILASKISVCDVTVPYTKYDRDPVKAVCGLLKTLKVSENSKIDLPPQTTYPDFLKYIDALSGFDVLCRPNGAHKIAGLMRETKDEAEIAAHRKAAAITDTIIDKIEEAVKANKIKTETDAALLIEKKLRTLGAECTSFDTLAAGPERSFGIHAFPSYTAGNFPGQGLSILDFGVKFNGYCSDVTLTIAIGPLTEEQQAQLALVENAYEIGLKYYQAGVPVRQAALKVNDVFAKAKKKMPHSLGHGVGLDIHEPPFVRPQADLDIVFKPGMIVTLEPGLYDKKNGGCRWENDILITDTGNESLTHSRIIRINC
jgi:Xaa-Pro dipeptidase